MSELQLRKSSMQPSESGFRCFVIMLALVSIFSSQIEVLAQGNLLITPRRVVFEGSKRSMDLNLANNGQDSATYAISIVQIRMNEDGGFETITEPDPGQQFADKFIRYFPRTITLGPGEAQAVKIQLVRSNELAEGEYRSHFYFRAVPKVTALGEEVEAQPDTTTITVKLTPVFGITIPIIVRSGTPTTKVELSGLGLSMESDTIPILKMTFNRSGNMSAYGDVAVDHISLQGKKTRVGNANGVAIYTPTTLRRFQIPLNRIPGIDFKSGKLVISYSSSSDVKPIKYAEAEVPLGK